MLITQGPLQHSGASAAVAAPQRRGAMLPQGLWEAPPKYPNIGPLRAPVSQIVGPRGPFGGLGKDIDIIDI